MARSLRLTQLCPNHRAKDASPGPSILPSAHFWCLACACPLSLPRVRLTLPPHQLPSLRLVPAARAPRLQPPVVLPSLPRPPRSAATTGQ
eukprot:6562179-Heterocapsa_arctica.AAC.1